MRLALPGLTMHLRAMLLHSLGTEHRVWQPQADVLAGTFRVLRPDLRGHGASDAPAGPYTIEGMARDVLAALDALGIERLPVAGLSIGGMVAQSLAAQAPDRISALALVDTALAIPPALLWRERAATVRAAGMAAIADAVLPRWLTPAADPAAGDGLRTMLFATAPEGYAGAAEAIAAADLTDTTRRLRLPAVVLVGEQDEATPRSPTDRTVARLSALGHVRGSAGSREAGRSTKPISITHMPEFGRFPIVTRAAETHMTAR